jgi:hypothetical protein
VHTTPDWDVDFFPISSEIQHLLAEIDEQLPRAKKSIVGRYNLGECGLISPDHDARVKLEKEFGELQSITMEIQSLRSDVKMLERESRNARGKGKTPDDRATNVPRQEMEGESWVEGTRCLGKVAEDVMGRLEEM